MSNKDFLKDVIEYLSYKYTINILELSRHFLSRYFPIDNIKTRNILNRTSKKNSRRSESQAHGFIWEDEILRKIYNAKPEHYTSVHDLSAENNKLEGVNVSIKTSGGKSVDMGDVKRIYQEISNIKDDSYINLIVVFYKQKKKYKNLEKVVEVKLYQNDLLKLFGGLSLSEITDYIEYIKAIPGGNPGNEKRKEYKNRQKILNEKTGFIKLRTKVDSNKQRRVQCSFPDFIKFCQEKEPSTVIINERGKLKGVNLTTKLLSSKRNLNKESRDNVDKAKNWIDLSAPKLKDILREAKKKDKKIMIGGRKEELVQRILELVKNGIIN